MNTATEVWTKVLNIMSKSLSDIAMTTWFDDCRCVDITDNKIILYSPVGFKREIVGERMSVNIKAALKDLFAMDFEVIMLSDDEMKSYRPKSEQTGPGRPDDEYTFENFVVGSSNKFAHAAAMNVAYGEDRSYNPLFIYGHSGLGKTHLLHAIRHVVAERHPEYNIVFVKGEEFMNELIHAIQMGKNLEFREKYRSADLFLIDDIQFIAGKVSTQEEFFHTFNTLFEANKQIVFASDRPPEDISRLEERLKSRMMCGLIADIQPPDYETRQAIIRNKANQLHVELPDEVTDYIATNLTTNVRQIEGAVKKTQAHCNIEQIDPMILTVTEIAAIIKDMFRKKTEYVPVPQDVIKETAKFFEVTPEEIVGQSRMKNVTQARQVAMYAIRKTTNLPMKDIGEYFQGRDHTTVLSSIRKIEKDMEKFKDLERTVNDIIANIQSMS